LAKKLANHPEAYLWGGKGWSFNQQEFISASVILSGYDYWNPDLQGYDTGIGLDCSGLVVWSFDRSNNPFLSRYNNVILAEGSNSQYHDNSEAINESDLQSGDLLFFGYYDQNKNVTTTTHVAMYVGNNGSYDVVHASSPQLGIRTAWKDSLKTEGNFLKTFGKQLETETSTKIISAQGELDAAKKLGEIKKVLGKKGIKAEIGTGGKRVALAGQVLGCNYSVLGRAAEQADAVHVLLK